MTQEKTISDLAYHLWRARGCPNGSAEIDWAEAERQVRGRMPGSADRALDAPVPASAPAAAPTPVGSPTTGVGVAGKAVAEKKIEDAAVENPRIGVRATGEAVADKKVEDAPVETSKTGVGATRAKKKAKR